MNTSITSAPTNYQRGFKRILLLIAVAWFGFWAIELPYVYFGEQHRKLIMYGNGDGSPVFSNSTLKHVPSFQVNSSHDRMIDGERFIFFFIGNRESTANWVRTMSPQDIDKAKSIAARSKRRALEQGAVHAFGPPSALLFAYILGYYVFRGFKPKPTQPGQ